VIIGDSFTTACTSNNIELSEIITRLQAIQTARNRFFLLTNTDADNSILSFLHQDLEGRALRATGPDLKQTIESFPWRNAGVRIRDFFTLLQIVSI
jgi:hypothetical protein